MTDFTENVPEGEPIPRPKPITTEEPHPGMEDDDEAVPETPDEDNVQGESL